MIRLVTRSSPLALAQVSELQSLIPEEELNIHVLESFGDKNKNLSLWEDQPQDFFTRELDQALREGRSDIALHSAKDLPCPLPEDLEVWALTPGKDPRDALVISRNMEKIIPRRSQGQTRDGSGSDRGLSPVGWGSVPGLSPVEPGTDPSISCAPPGNFQENLTQQLPRGFRIATSSTTRKAQIMELYPHWEVVPIRGTIGERLQYLDEDRADGVIVAACALDRLGWSHRIFSYLPLETHPLQGHLAVVGLRARPDLKARFERIDVRKNWGRVWIAGAGPGDPELLTIKVQKLIETADIIFHDALGAPSVLEKARGELVHVGKRRGHHEKTQSQTNQLLYQAALQGKTVLRLKGGDPFIFGRGSEEVDFLRSRMVSVQVVPGISSALGAAAAFALPLTERNVSRSVAFCTGWPEDLIQAPGADTLVYFMGAGSLNTLAQKNMASGKSASTPVALIFNATLGDQQIWRTTLGEMTTSEFSARPFPTPLLVIIGEVARSGRPWFETAMPEVVWYTGTDPEKFSTDKKIFHHSLIKFSTLEDYTQLDQKLTHLGENSWAVFTSRETVRAVFHRMSTLGLDTRAWGKVKIAAVGRATAEALKSQGVMADFLPPEENAQALVEAFPSYDVNTRDSHQVFFPCSQLALRTLEIGLSQKNWKVARTTAYLTLSALGPETLPVGLREIYFTSPSTVHRFFELYSSMPPGVQPLTRGLSTKKALQEYLK